MINKNSSLHTEYGIEQLPGYIIWKDMDSIYLKTNTNAARLLGFRCSDDLIGLTDYDLRCEAADYAEAFITEDKNITNKALAETTTILYIHGYSDNKIKTLIGNKAIFYDELSNPIGIVCQLIEIAHHILKNLFFSSSLYPINRSKTYRGSYYLNSPYPEINLSKQQALCLFYVLRGKTNKVIAQILKLSPRTVEAYLDNIKHKMGCINKANLIEKSIELGFLEIVPLGILKQALSKPFSNENLSCIKRSYK